MGKKSWYWPLLIFVMCTISAQAAAETRFAFVQYEVEAENYRSPDAFQTDIEALVHTAVNGGAECVVFPEYINVFLALMPLSRRLEGIDSVAAGVELLRNVYGDNIGLKEFFILQLPEVRELMDRIWGGLAKRYGIWIVAGTAFAAENGSGPSPPGSAYLDPPPVEPVGPPSLYNRLFVYSPDGEIVYTQDKVYLTPFEKDTVGLDAGRVAAAHLIHIKKTLCGFTICRDTFFDDWETGFSGADLWIDLKANGDVYDTDAEAVFETALPERIRNTGISLGATVCLNGSFMELFWEGPSSVIKPASIAAGFETIVEAASPVQEEILLYIVE